MSSYLLMLPEPRRLSLVQIRASSDDSPAPVDAGELFSDLKEKVRDFTKPRLLLKQARYSFSRFVQS